MRAVAVGVVIAYHANVPGFGGGYVGVDVFFVLSGFLITRLLLDEVRRSGTISILGFYARRFRRILPAATVVFIAALVVARFRTNPLDHAQFATDGQATALFAMNIRGTLSNNDYLAQSNVITPFLHFWSLAVEEQFYAVWPLLLLVTIRLRRGVGDPARQVAWVIGTVFVASLALSVWWTPRNPVWSFYLLPTRAWELAAGGLVAAALPRLRELPTTLAAWIGWAGLAAVGASSLWFTTQLAFPGWVAAVPVFGTVAVLVGGCVSPRFGPEWLLARRPFQVIGALSFSLYLWHWPILVALHDDGRLKQYAILAVLLAILAPATYYLVENPIRHSKGLGRRPTASVGLGLAMAATMLVAVPVVLPTAVLAAPRPSSGPVAVVTATAVRAPAGSPPPASFVPSNLVPPLGSVLTVRTEITTDGCQVSEPVSTPKQPCRFGDVGSNRLVVMFGDSHTSQWVPALVDIGRRRHWDIEVVAKSGCPASSVRVTKRGHPYPQCDRWRAQALALIARQRPQLVIISDGDNDEVNGVSAPASRVRAIATAGLRATIDAIPRTTAVLVLGPTPRMPVDVPHCLADHLTTALACTGPRADAVDTKRIAAEEAVAAATGATYVDTAPLVCRGDPCPAIAWNLLIYSDEQHLLPDFARSLAPDLLPRLVAATQAPRRR